MSERTLKDLIGETWDIVTLNGIDYVRVEEKVRTAIKLQESVKKTIPLLKISVKEFKQESVKEYDFQRAKLEILQSLVEESEK